MTDILCKWLNEEVKLSRRIDADNFAHEFSTGYLIGEVLSNYQLQDDFDQFSQSKMADGRLNNFMRLEPMLNLLEIAFDTNVARDMMTEKFGVATRVMYQLFVALNKKQKSNLTGVAMETMRPAAPVKLEGVESVLYRERLKQMTPRQTDLNLTALVARFHEKQIEMEKNAFRETYEEEEANTLKLMGQRQELIRKYKEKQAKKSDMLAKIQAAVLYIPKPPTGKVVRAIAQRHEQRKQKIVDEMCKDVEVFEERMKRTLPPSKPIIETEDDAGYLDPLDCIREASNEEYIGRIRKRLNEDRAARSEREKRRRKVMVDQLQAHEAQENARQEEILVNRLMRQSQQERRIAVQLLQARHEKEVICRNRRFQEKRFEQQRLKEFEEALNREAELTRLAKLEYLDQTQKDQELHNQIMAERAEARYLKHYDMASDVLGDIIDIVTRVAEYRDLTNKLLPPKLMREWTTLFVEGKSIYEVAEESSLEITTEQLMEFERQALLNEADLHEYRNMVGEWTPMEGIGITGPPRSNPVVGHIVQRLFNLVHPPSPLPDPPCFPPYPIKACVLGKMFSGKSTILRHLVRTHRLQILEVEDLINQAIDAYKNGEVEHREADDDPDNSESLIGFASATTLVEKKPTEATVGSAQTNDTPGGTEDNKSRGTTGGKSAGKSSAGKLSRKSQEENEADESGEEKGDSEKPINDVESECYPMASARARLGAKALKNLADGTPPDDDLLVSILVDGVRRVAEGSGWVTDGFPTTYAQAKLLEKALSGFDSDGMVEVKTAGDGTTDSKETHQSILAPDPSPPVEKPKPRSGIDVVIHLDVPDELCLKRSAGRTYHTHTNAEYHREFDPPPDGSTTGVGKMEKVLPVVDSAHDMEQIQHRLTTYQDNWPKIEKWYTRFGSLKKIDATLPKLTVYLEVENIMDETLQMVAGQELMDEVTDEMRTEEELKVQQEKAAVQEVRSSSSVTLTSVKDDASKTPTSPRKHSPKTVSGKGSRSSSVEKKGRTGSRADSKKSAASRESRGKSGKGLKGKDKTPEPEPVEDPEPPPSTPPPEPGSELWEYVDMPVDYELSRVLVPHWEIMENTYVTNCKDMFRKLRREREQLIRYFYQIRKDFLEYLRRPDHKQEFLVQWQKDYNAVSDDLRADDETRGELHQRVDDLRERLWSICDDRKDQAEREREDIINDGWLDDHIGLLTNIYITLSQAEVDRFQDTVRVLKDYYRGMEGKTPDSTVAAEYPRLPLVEIPATEPMQVELAIEETGEEGGEVGGATPTTQDGSKAGSPLAKRDTLMSEVLVEKKTRIPIVPRRPTSPDTAASGTGAKPKLEKGAKQAKIPSKEGCDDAASPPPTDLDEKLLYDAYMMAVSSVDAIVSTEQAAREQEEEAERLREAEAEMERQKMATEAGKKGGGKAGAAGGGKGGKGGKKSRSPSPKKGKGATAKDVMSPEPTPQPEESEEDKLKTRNKERAVIEFFGAIREEAAAAHVRTELVKAVATNILRDLKTLADNAYKDMYDWLGARFLKEMESIDQMSEIVRYGIETGIKLKEELVLEQEDFIVSPDVKMLKSPSPIPRPPLDELPTENVFTVQQIIRLHKQFMATAPSGLLALKAFQELLQDYTTLTYGTEQMPDAWMNISPDKLEVMAGILSPDGEYIDWHMFLLDIAQPWPMATQTELLDTMTRFKELDQQETGHVSQEQYDQVQLWFTDETQPSSPADPAQPDQFNRLAALKDSFFRIFADYDQSPPMLDYTSMMLYFSAATDCYEGFLRALSVATGCHMPRIPHTVTTRKISSSRTSLVLTVEMDGPVVQDEGPTAPEDIPESAIRSKVPLDCLYMVLHQGQRMSGDSHRFNISTEPEDINSNERLRAIYEELGAEDFEPLLFTTLTEHPAIADMISNCNIFHSVRTGVRTRRPLHDSSDLEHQDTRPLVNSRPSDILDTQSMKTNDT